MNTGSYNRGISSNLLLAKANMGSEPESLLRFRAHRLLVFLDSNASMEQTFDAFDVGRRDIKFSTAFAPRTFTPFSAQVPAALLAPFQFAAPGDLEPFRGCFVCFQFRHCEPSFLKS